MDKAERGNSSPLEARGVWGVITTCPLFSTIVNEKDTYSYDFSLITSLTVNLFFAVGSVGSLKFIRALALMLRVG